MQARREGLWSVCPVPKGQEIRTQKGREAPSTPLAELQATLLDAG